MMPAVPVESLQGSLGLKQLEDLKREDPKSGSQTCRLCNAPEALRLPAPDLGPKMIACRALRRACLSGHSRLSDFHVSKVADGHKRTAIWPP